MATFEQRILTETAERIDAIVETLEELAEWAEGAGYGAIQHKIEEGVGRIQSAATAASQYAEGTLTPH